MEGADNRRGRAGVAQLDDGEAVVAHERDGFAIGRKLGIVAGADSRKADLDAGAVAQVVDPQAAVGIEQQVGGVRRPDVAGHAVAVAMVAVPLRFASVHEGDHLFAAHEDMRLAGAGIEIDELAAIDIGQVFAVGRPGETRGRVTDERSIAKIASILSGF